MIRKIITYPFIAIGAMGCLFFGAYTGTLIPYSTLFAILSLGLAVGAWYLSWHTPASKQKAAMLQTIQEEIQELKKDGYKIKVAFEDCALREHHYTEERERYTDRNIQALNAWGGDPMKNVENIRIQQTVIIYTYTYPDTGATETFISPVIYKDRQSLLHYLSRQKETYIYVNRDYEEYYYFDLDFLPTT